ncbi:uncharacterized protein [Clytia hemisphaerica]|uniref:uncharacterized protein n=1 Tax=Clytia hemisphaerica TaxID=252671 RepID=UPI0034D62A10
MSGNFQQEIFKLKPKIIDPSKCTKQKSLKEQILKNSQQTSQRQSAQFNLGNGQFLHDPITASEILLEREYGDTFLFKHDRHEPVFIPPVFVSNQFSPKLTSTILDYNIVCKFEETLANRPDFWFTKELKRFMAHQSDQNFKDVQETNKVDYENWILNVKIIYLMITELAVDYSFLPSCQMSIDKFLQECTEFLNGEIDLLRGHMPLDYDKITPYQKLISFLNMYFYKPRKIYKSEIEDRIKSTPPKDSVVSWFFSLELSEQGEKIEHCFFKELSSMRNTKSNLLQDLVILQSVNFLTDVKKKKHQEFDLCLISWSRKLIIAVEMKRQLVNYKPFEQLDKYHQIFEERLGDFLGSGWTFFPVLCVEIDEITFENPHYISIETDISSWLQCIMKKFLVSLPTQIPYIHPIETLKELLRIIVFTIHISKKNQAAPITSSNWVDYISNSIDTLLTRENIVFYSTNQLPVFVDNLSYNKLVICGGYGTGKSFLLQEKALLLNKDPGFKGKVFYGCYSKDEWDLGRSLHFQRLKHELQPHGIMVYLISEKDLWVSSGILVKEAMVHGMIKAVFLDEMDISDVKSIEDLADLVDFIWIAPNASSLIGQKHIGLTDSFETLDLALNLRNTEEIVKKSKAISDQIHYRYENGLRMPPPNFPNGCTPISTDSLEKALTTARQSTLKGILIITDDITSTLSKISKIEPNVKVFGKDQSDFDKWENPYEFLTRPGSVLLTDSHTASGFEWPTVILFLAADLCETKMSSIEKHKCNLTLRCTTNLYIIKTDSKGEDVNIVESFYNNPNIFLSAMERVLRKSSVQADDQFYRCAARSLTPFLSNIFFIMKESKSISGIFFKTFLESEDKVNSPEISAIHAKAENQFFVTMEKTHETIKDFQDVFVYLRSRITSTLNSFVEKRNKRITILRDYGLEIPNGMADSEMSLNQYLVRFIKEEDGIDKDDSNNETGEDAELNKQFYDYYKKKMNTKMYLKFFGTRPVVVEQIEIAKLAELEFDSFFFALRKSLKQWERTPIGKFEEGQLKSVADNALVECLSCTEFDRNEVPEDVKETLRTKFDIAFNDLTPHQFEAFQTLALAWKIANSPTYPLYCVDENENLLDLLYDLLSILEKGLNASQIRRRLINADFNQVEEVLSNIYKEELALFFKNLKLFSRPYKNTECCQQIEKFLKVLIKHAFKSKSKCFKDKMIIDGRLAGEKKFLKFVSENLDTFTMELTEREMQQSKEEFLKDFMKVKLQVIFNKLSFK